MFYIQIEILCNDEEDLTKWWAIADKNKYFLTHYEGKLRIVGHKVTQTQIDELTGLVEQYSTHSIFIREEPDEQKRR